MPEKFENKKFGFKFRSLVSSENLSTAGTNGRRTAVQIGGVLRYK